MLGNESPYLITNPEKGTLLLTGDIIFVLGDSNDHKSQREKEFLSGMKVRNQFVEITAGLKVPNQELSEAVLESVDDEVILKLIKKELAGTEKERKKAKLHMKQKQNLEQYKKKQEEGKMHSERKSDKPPEMQRNVSDVAKIVILDNQGKKNHENAVMEESKESSLIDELQGEELPEEDEKRMEYSSEDEKQNDQINNFKTPKVIPPQSNNNEDSDEEIKALPEKPVNKSSNEHEGFSHVINEIENNSLSSVDENNRSKEDDEANEMSGDNDFKIQYVDTITNLLKIAK